MNLEALQQVLSLGAPNDENNTTMAEGEKVEQLLSPFVDTIGVVCNPTTSYPINADLISIDELREWGVKEDARLFLHVQVITFAGETVEIGVANFLRYVKSFGEHDAIVKIMDFVRPKWREDPDGDFLAKVAALPGLTGAIGEPPPVAYSPDWEKPRGDGFLGARAGDNVKEGTQYTSPSGVVWQAGTWLTQFEMVWKRM